MKGSLHICIAPFTRARNQRSQKSSCFLIVAIILCSWFASCAVVGMATARA
jgi:hypothetical protein